MSDRLSASRRGLAVSIRRSPTFIGALTRSRRWSCARRQPFRPNLSATIEAPSPVPLLSAGGLDFTGLVSLVGRTFVVLGGAHLLRVHRIRPASRARRCRSGSRIRGRVVRRSGSRRRHASAERALPRSCGGGHQPASPLGSLGALQAPVATNQRGAAVTDCRSGARRRLASASADPGWRCRRGIDRRDRGAHGGDGVSAAVRHKLLALGAGTLWLSDARTGVAPLASGVRGRPRGPGARRESRGRPAAGAAWSRDRAAACACGRVSGVGGLAHARSQSARPGI